MKKITLPVVLALSTLIISACSSLPRTTTLLDQTRSEYQAAQNSPNVGRYAPLEMKQATDALALADVAARNRENDDTIDNLAYLAKQKIALTQEVAKQKSAEAGIASAGDLRDQMRLDQRTSEADQAKASAEKAKQATQAAQDQTALANQNNQAAQDRATKLEAQLADLSAKKTDRGMVITLGDVLFGTDLSRLNPDGMLTAQKLADVLQQNPERHVLIEGFTDSTGSNSHNQALSERRATSVQRALLELGVTRDRVSVRGYGEEYPVAANDTADNRQLNRRVEIVLSDASGNIAKR